MSHAELATLGGIAVELSSASASEGLERALEVLRAACGAGSCELFLREPGGGDLVLSAIRTVSKDDEDAFLSRNRFPRGRGLPGIVAATGHELRVGALRDDSRFLRHRVTARGFSRYICVPVPGRTTPIGTLGLAWSADDIAIGGKLALIGSAATLIGSVMQTALETARHSVAAALRTVPRRDRDGQYRTFLALLRHASGARAATLVLPGPPGGSPTILSTADAPVVCSAALQRNRLQCPVLAQGHGAVLQPSGSCGRASCAGVPTADASTSLCCVPLRRHDVLEGAVFLDYGPSAPTPPARDLVSLLAMATRGSRLLLDRSAASASTVGEGAPILTLNCLGSTELRLGQRVLGPGAFSRRKALTLLEMLMLRAGNPAARESLVEALWPGVSPDAGANRFHVVLHALRAVIEPLRDQRRWIYIRNQGDLYYFNMEAPHRIDLYAFRHLAAASHQLERQGRALEAVECMEEAAALYRGDLLADEPYAAWCGAERDHVRASYFELVHHMAELCFSLAIPERAVPHLRRALLADPLREGLHQKLIEALARLGRRGEALAQYRTCAELLQRELETDPLPETRELLRSTLAR